MRSLPHLIVMLVALAGCGEEPEERRPPPPAVDLDLNPALIAERPFGVVVPSSYSGAPTPLVIALHGLGHNGPDYAGPGGTSGLAELAESRGFILAYPDGVEYELDTPFGTTFLRAWNASCCNAFAAAIAPYLVGEVADDIAYLRAVIAQLRVSYAIDDARIYAQGMSNGGFMAHTLACAAADKLAAIAPMAGTFFTGEQRDCEPSEPVAVMHTHGTADETVDYDGGALSFGTTTVNHIGAPETAFVWQTLNGCGETPTTRTADAEATLAGEETTVSTWADGCTAGRSVELWTITGGAHVPTLTPAYGEALIDFLFAHPK